MAFDTVVGRETADVGAVDARGPEVVRVHEGDVRRADRGLREQPRVADVGIPGGRGRRQEEGEEQRAERTVSMHESLRITSRGGHHAPPLFRPASGARKRDLSRSASRAAWARSLRERTWNRMARPRGRGASQAREGSRERTESTPCRQTSASSPSTVVERFDASDMESVHCLQNGAAFLSHIGDNGVTVRSPSDGTMTRPTFPIEPPVEPMLAALSAQLPESAGFLFEPKWDGFRALVFRGGGDVFIQSRDLRPLDRYFPELRDALREAVPDGAVIDGEIVIATTGGLDFDALQLRLHPAASRVARLARESPASFVAFDVLAADGQDLRMLRQDARRRRPRAAARRACARRSTSRR